MKNRNRFPNLAQLKYRLLFSAFYARLRKHRQHLHFWFSKMRLGISDWFRFQQESFSIGMSIFGTVAGQFLLAIVLVSVLAALDPLVMTYLKGSLFPLHR